MLWFPTVAGLIVFLYGLITYDLPFRDDVDEVCGAPGNNMTMCAVCETCETFPLSTQCSFYRVAYVFDNELTPVFALFVAVWASAFLDVWARTRANFSRKLEIGKSDNTVAAIPRPQFWGYLTRHNPLSGRSEGYFPKSERRKRYIVSSLLTLAFLAVTFICLLSVFSFRQYTREELGRREYNDANSSLGASVAAGVVSLVIILVFNAAYEAIARRLTEYENHRTRQQHRKYFAQKIWLFNMLVSAAPYPPACPPLTGRRRTT